MALSDETLLLALGTFKKATALLVFFHGQLLAVYDADADYVDVIESIPKTFGGLRVSITLRSNPITSTSGSGREKAVDDDGGQTSAGEKSCD